jgi:caspase domain-containing protein/pentapeptide repeat protein
MKNSLRTIFLLFCYLSICFYSVSAQETPIILVLFKGDIQLVDQKGTKHDAETGQVIDSARFPHIQVGNSSTMFLKKADRLVQIMNKGTYAFNDLFEKQGITIADTVSFLKMLVQPRSFVSGAVARGNSDSQAISDEQFFESLWERIVIESDDNASTLLAEDYLSCAAWFHRKGLPARTAFIFERLTSLQAAENDFYRQLRMESFRGIRLEEINRELKTTRQRIAAASTTLHYKALLIGINEYHHPAWQKLKNPISDVRALKEVLVDQYHFGENDITVLENASYDDIISSFNILKRVAGNDTSLFVYYAGHGFYPEDEGEGYWIPSDAGEPDSLRLFLPTSIILGKIKSIKSRHTLLIADSCFSGSLVRKSRGASTNSRFYLDLSRKKSRQVITSGGLEPVDDQGAGNHSIFAGKLLNILSRDRQEPLSASELAFSLRKEVKEGWGAQTPEYGRLHISDDESGEFFFVQRQESRKNLETKPVLISPEPVIAAPLPGRKHYDYKNLPRGTCLAPRPFTDLRDCDFQGKKISNVNMEGVNLQGVDFKYVELEDVNLDGANLSDTDWRYSSLDGVKARHSTSVKTEWRYSKINDSDFSHSNFANCDLRYSSLNDINFDYADLSNCDLRNSYLDDVTLKEANLRDVNSNSNQLFGDRVEGVIEGIQGAMDGIIDKKSEEVPAGPTSKDNRSDSFLFLGVTPFSYSIPESNFYPFQLGFYPGSGHLLGIEYGFINKDKSSETLSYNAELITRGVFYRLFPGGSFNLLIALNQLSWIAESTAYTKPGSEMGYRVKDEETVNIGTFAIGNQWLLDSGVTIGCDWALISTRIGDPKSSREITNLGGTETELARAKSELGDLEDTVEKDILFSSRNHILSITMGYSF